jgi:hypothetical protein
VPCREQLSTVKERTATRAFVEHVRAFDVAAVDDDSPAFACCLLGLRFLGLDRSRLVSAGCSSADGVSCLEH